MLTTHEKAQLMKKQELLAENPVHPSLRTTRIQGTDTLYESSANMDIRAQARRELTISSSSTA